MIKSSRRILIISYLIFIQGYSQAYQDSIQQKDPDVKSSINLRTYVESESVPQNLEVVYHIELKWYGDLNRYKIGHLEEPSSTNLIHRGSGSRNIVSTDSEGRTISIKRVTYYFKPVEMGMAYIDDIIIKYEDTLLEQEGNLISSRIGVKIIDPLPEPSEIFGLKELIFILIVLVIIILIFYFYLRYQKKKKQEKELDLQRVKETVEEKYIRLLKETIQFNIDNIKETMVDLSHLLTGYFSERYNIPSANLSTSDLIQVLSEKNIPEDLLSRIEEFYKQSDLIKFAGSSINESEFHRFYDSVEIILNNQKQRHEKIDL